MSDEFQRNDFTGFEYREITVKKMMQSVYTDSFGSFGWITEGISDPVGKIDSVVMKFKRNRKIRNKAELTRLQRQFEAGVAEIISLERSKTTKAAAIAYGVGVLGTACMTGSVFAVTAGNIPFCVILAVPGFIGWIIPYWIFKNVSRKKTEAVNPSINQYLKHKYSKKESSKMAKSKLVKTNEKIAEGVISGYKKIEEGVVGGYKKIEKGTVGSFCKITDKFVDNFLTKEGESVEEAKERLTAEQKEREEVAEVEREKHRVEQNIVIEASIQKAQNATLDARRKAGIES